MIADRGVKIIHGVKQIEDEEDTMRDIQITGILNFQSHKTMEQSP